MEYRATRTPFPSHMCIAVFCQAGNLQCPSGGPTVCAETHTPSPMLKGPHGEEGAEMITSYCAETTPHTGSTETCVRSSHSRFSA